MHREDLDSHDNRDNRHGVVVEVEADAAATTALTINPAVVVPAMSGGRVPVVVGATTAATTHTITTATVMMSPLRLHILPVGVGLGVAVSVGEEDDTMGGEVAVGMIPPLPVGVGEVAVQKEAS